MSSLFVVMYGGDSPVAIVIPTPRAVFKTRKQATAYINVRQYPHLWYVRKAENMIEDSK